MADEPPLIPSPRGYVSDESKRRFTPVVGILAAVVFLAQMLLPMLLMFAFMIPTMTGAEVSTTDVTQAALWRDELWLVEQTARVDFRDPEGARSTLSLLRVRPADLEHSGPAIPLDAGANDAPPALLPIGDRLWLIGEDAVRHYQNGTLTRLSGPGRPAGASKPFAWGGLPAVLSLGTPPTIATVRADEPNAVWAHRAVPLTLPPEAGALRGIQAVEASGVLYLIVEVCTEQPDRCSLRYRTIDEPEWHSLVPDACSCASWAAIALDGRPAIVLSEEKKETNRFAVITVPGDGPRREAIELQDGRVAWSRWGALARGSDLLLIAQGMPGGLRLAEVEVAGGRVVRSVRRASSFPFGRNLLLIMSLVQIVPVLLSLAFAFVLTAIMRRHRVREYVLAGQRREFASLGRRAVAHLVDSVPIMGAFAASMTPLWRMMSDPESWLEEGTALPLLVFGLLVASFAWAVLVLVGYSYLEGRFGKTPGKWLTGIRVIGTDLQPCGFGRALLRNLLTLVDGIFSFLVGALVVAFTEHWQRLGDMAARTVVVVDQE